MRGSDFYQRYIEAIMTIAKSQQSDWKARIEFLVQRFQGETTPLSRTTLRQLTNDMSRELEGISRMCSQGTNKEAYVFAASLLRRL